MKSSARAPERQTAGRRATLARRIAAVGVVSAALVGTATVSASANVHHASSGAYSFYHGKTLEVLVPNAPGGNIDTTARVAAPYLQKALGAAGVRVVDVTGAGGVVGLDQLWNTTRDGLTVGYTNLPVALLTSLVGGKGITYHANLLTYLGRMTAQARVVVISEKSPITKVSQLRGKTLKVPISGFDDSFYTMAALGHTLGFKPEWVSGFASVAAATTSIASGATDIEEGSLATLDPAIQSHLVRPLLIETSGRVPSKYSNLPRWSTVAGASNAGLVKAFVSLVSIEGTFFFAPHAPKNAIYSFRHGMRVLFQDKAFKAAEKKAGSSLSWLDGKDEQKAVVGLSKDMKPYLPLLRNDLKAAQAG